MPNAGRDGSYRDNRVGNKVSSPSSGVTGSGTCFTSPIEGRDVEPIKKTVTRRRYLGVAGGAIAVGLAGCADDGDGDDGLDDMDDGTDDGLEDE